MSAFYPSSTESGDRRGASSLVARRLCTYCAPFSLPAAVNAVRRSGEWRTIYLRKKARAKPAKQALVVVAVKLLHALYELKHGSPTTPHVFLVAPATIGS